MNKKLFSVLALMLTGLSVFSQTKEIRISPFRFGGVHALTTPSGEARGYYALHAGSNGRWGFHLYDTHLQEINHAEIETPRHSVFNSMVTNGEQMLASFVLNAFRTSVTYVIMDAAGNETARLTRENLPLLNRGEQFFPQLFLHPDQGFIIVESVRGRRPGYSVEHVDKQLNTLWRREFFPSRGTGHVYGLWPQAGQIVILDAVERTRRTRNTRLLTLDPENGDHMLTMDLTDKDFTYFPTAVQPGPNGQVAVTGTYYKGERILSKNSQGLFFLNIGPSGETLAMELFDWRGLRGLLRTDVYDWFFKVMPEVWIHALDRNEDGSFIAIGELYRYAGIRRDKKEERFHRVRLFDFMAFRFDPNGQMESALRIHRPHMILKLDAEVSGGGSGPMEDMVNAGPLSRGRALKQFGGFTYRYHRKTADDQIVLAFMGYEGFAHYAYSVEVFGNSPYLQMPLTKSHPKVFTALQMIDHVSGQYDPWHIIHETNTRSFDGSDKYWRGILPAVEGKLMTYEYMPLTGRLWLNLVDAY